MLLPSREHDVKTTKVAIEKPRKSEGTGRRSVLLVGTPVELHYSPEGFPLALSTSQGSALHLFDTPSPSQGFKKMPPESGATRYYDEFSIAGKKFLVITEVSNPPNLYLDANLNGDLTDDMGPFAGENPQLIPNFYTLQLPYDR